MCHNFDNIDDFFVVEKEGRIQHISWIYSSGQPNRILDLVPGDAEIKYCLTLPEYRGQGIYPLVLREIVLYLSNLGTRWIFICVKDDNTASIKGIEKVGFVLLMTKRLRKIFGIQVSQKLNTKELRTK